MNEIIANVVNNVVIMMAVILVAYATIFILEKIIYFIINAFSNIKVFDGWLKKMNISGFNIRRKL